MFKFFRNSFGKGGNTLPTLIIFFGIGLVLHYQGNTVPLINLWKELKGEPVVNVDNYATDTKTVSSKKNPNNEDTIAEETPQITTDNNSDLARIINRPLFHVPKSKNNLQVVNHTAITIGYAERYEQAAWVAYPLTSKQVVGNVKRENNFRPDPKVKTGSALHVDYTGSGYDRGHLAPAADFRSNKIEMQESFYMSNISPQNREFNAGIWADLEAMVRVWAQRYDKVYVVTGPVLKSNLPMIGRKNKVAVPEQFYKVVLYVKPPYIKAIGFLMDNEPGKGPLSKYVVPISKIEAVTGLEFFPMLPKAEKEKILNTVNPKEWPRLK